MAKILFINGNIHGHINPTLPVVKELVRRGEDVSYCSTEEFKQKIIDTGAHFLGYSNKLTDFLQTYQPSGNHPFYTLIEFILAMDRVIVPIIREMISDANYDVIIHDVMLGGGNILAKQLGVPAISTCSSFAMDKIPVPSYMLERGYNPQLDHIYTNLKNAEEEWNVGDITIDDIFFKKETLNLVFTSTVFQPESDQFDSTFRFIGPSIAPREEDIDISLDLTPQKKLIYISMGTINNKCHEFYLHCINAFQETDYQVIMSVGNKTDINSFPIIPKNFIIRNYVPQLQVLQRADLFISHGGLNSVSEALYYCVPIIVIPQANDQYMVSRQLVKLQAGIELKMEEITPELLNEKANMILSDNSFKLQSQNIGQSFRKSGGFKAAADYIEVFINNLI